MDREIELEEIETAAFKDRYGAKAMPAQVHSQGCNDDGAVVSGAQTTHFVPSRRHARRARAPRATVLASPYSGPRSWEARVGALGVNCHLGRFAACSWPQ